jgi:hypothetical protein
MARLTYFHRQHHVNHEVPIHPWEAVVHRPVPGNIMTALVFRGQQLQLCLKVDPMTVQCFWMQDTTTTGV